MATTGTYLKYPALKDALPPLVKKQRALAAKIATVAQTIKDEEATRKEIDALLVTAGLKKGELVTCGVYDVRHHERDGPERISPKTTAAYLRAMEWTPEDVAAILVAITDIGKAACFASVTVTKGAKVRAA